MNDDSKRRIFMVGALAFAGAALAAISRLCASSSALTPPDD